ncbi:ATP-binding protein [Amycolatopsis samaneae]|uniref:ATP-binding protein n=1 Tax=Amycolatopsis samaneae TaxID=664691 RepID=A0ABW5G8C9_9PSEU
MRAGDAAERDDDRGRGQRAEMSGSASDVVQARDVHGGVHFHGGGHSAEPVPRQLPGDVRGFVNRRAELERLDEALGADRGELPAVGVYVIVGTAGVGKTSLALHWAHSARWRFPHGQLFASLRGYDPGPPVSPEQVLDRFLRALGVRPEAVPAELEDRAALYRSLLADRRVLVLLDNAATVGQIRPLLPGNAECLVLVTSRSRLSGLVARDGARRLALDTLSEEEAVTLLRTVTAGYRGQDSHAELTELAGLCARLPLALRIAAERASSRPLMLLAELITDLRDESALWDALTAEDDEEADAVRTVFAWSYRALPEAAARLFRKLGWHPGPEFGIPAAAALADGQDGETRHLLDVLVGAHMLEQRAPGRYQFHDLLRAYANDQAVHQETPETRRAALERVVSWYLRAASAAVRILAPLNRHLDVGPEVAVTPLTFADLDAAFRWYEEEQVNLVAAVRAAAEAGLHGHAWKLAAVLRSVYARRSLFEDWIATARIGLDSARRVHDRAGEAELLESLGMAYSQTVRLSEAEECHTGALIIRRATGDRLGAALSVTALGLLAWRKRRLAEARNHFGTALAACQELGERRWSALAQVNLGMVLGELGEHAAAVRLLDEAVVTLRELGDRAYEGSALFELAAVQRELGEVDDALTSIQDALGIARAEHNLAWEAFWLLEAARVHRAAGQPAEALIDGQRSAAIQRGLGDRNREAMALDGTGESYRALGRPDEAAKFHRLAVATHRELGDRWRLAGALANLAMALQEAEEPEDAHTHWAEASAVLAEFDDPRAVRLRERVEENLAAGAS